jgi:hypothetical protein
MILIEALIDLAFTIWEFVGLFFLSAVSGPALGEDGTRVAQQAR